MAYEEITMLLGGWEGFELVNVLRQPATGDAGPVIELELRPVPNYAKRCSNCGEVVAVVHDASPRRVRDLPILEAETWVVFPRARLACPRCGPTVVSPRARSRVRACSSALGQAETSASAAGPW